jgi:hypothetical protein
MTFKTLKSLPSLIDRVEDAKTREALLELDNVLKRITAQLTQPAAELTRLPRPTEVQSLIYPKSSNQPPLSQPVEGLGFFNTSRKRFQKSFDTWPYYDYPTPEGCRVRNSGDQTLANNTATVITFNTEVWDHIGLYTSAAPTRITFPLDGRYHVGGHLMFDDNVTGRRSISIRKNGVTTLASMNQMAITDAGIVTRVTIDTIDEFVTGDYVELVGLQTSGGNLDVQTEGVNSPVFYAHRLG